MLLNVRSFPLALGKDVHLYALLLLELTWSNLSVDVGNRTKRHMVKLKGISFQTQNIRQIRERFLFFLGSIIRSPFKVHIWSVKS